ncbi:hypothetical protein A2U01_0061594 [Trifolium medium]|uniref:Uncharacterized protein n=1 Tax=Trifolium medium TaxID=97028 RepID=A0A392RUP4_9FABA|nr:hypothetical protein [Trifolium medium]
MGRYDLDVPYLKDRMRSVDERIHHFERKMYNHYEVANNSSDPQIDDDE